MASRSTPSLESVLRSRASVWRFRRGAAPTLKPQYRQPPQSPDSWPSPFPLHSRRSADSFLTATCRTTERSRNRTDLRQIRTLAESALRTTDRKFHRAFGRDGTGYPLGHRSLWQSGNAVNIIGWPHGTCWLIIIRDATTLTPQLNMRLCQLFRKCSVPD